MEHPKPTETITTNCQNLISLTIKTNYNAITQYPKPKTEHHHLNPLPKKDEREIKIQLH